MQQLLTGLKIIAIGSALLWSLPTLADETSSSTPEVSPTPASTLIVRYHDQIIFSGEINLTSTTYHDIINNIDYPLNGTSTIFSLLVNADLQSDAFSISDDQFNSNRNSFYLNCLNLTLATTTENKCGSWQYTVDGQYPFVGMDKKELSGNENIYIYFGDRYNFTTEKNSYSVNEVVTTTIKEYAYSINDWTLMDGQIVLATTQPDFSNYSNWPPAQTISSVSTTNGLALFQFTTSGTYYITLPDYSYWPYLTISVTSTITTSTQTNTSTNQQPQNGGGSSALFTVSNTDINNSVQKILNFLKSRQSDNGSIVDLQMSDWSAMSFGANGTYANDIRTSTASLYNYLYSTIVTSTSETLNICAEYPRHILGLLSAGTNKTDTKIVELKNKISNECFIGGMVGQNGINDDIFITIALLATDENPNSAIIQAAIQTIIADQQTNGAFTWSGWPGQDVTGAAINALKYAASFGVAIDDAVFQNAKNYLHTTQLADGGWTGFGTISDPLTTSWALYGINALGEGQLQWTNTNQKNPWSALVATLDNNGYYTSPWSSDGIDWFGTKHAVPALLGKSWPIVLNPISQELPPASNNSSGGTYTAPQTTSTSSVLTDIISTSTAPTSTEVFEVLTASTTIIAAEPTSTGQVLGISIVNTEIQTEAKKPTRTPAQIKTQTQLPPETQAGNNPTSTNAPNQSDVLEADTVLAPNYTNRILYSVLAGLIGIIGYIIIIKIKK